MNDVFHKFASQVAKFVGSAHTFIAAFSIIIVWLITGPIFEFSDAWQLLINTGTTIITFLMVFLIQNTQNRDSVAIHLKLDELIKAVHGARNSMVNIEELSDVELEHLHDEFRQLQEKYLKSQFKRGNLKLVVQKETATLESK